jgi:hypothetical protein
MKRAGVFPSIALFLMPIALSAAECVFELADDDSLRQAMDELFAQMAILEHGAYQQGDLSEIREMYGVLVEARDELMAAHFPATEARKCPGFSTKALLVSAQVDLLAKTVEDQADDAKVRLAFDALHEALCSMREAMFTAGDLIEGIHDIIRPMWHEAYPARDVEAIRQSLPKLAIRAKLLANFVEQQKLDHLEAPVAKFIASLDLMEDAVAADDEFAIFASLEQVHRAFHRLSEASGIEYRGGGEAQPLKVPHT